MKSTIQYSYKVKNKLKKFLSDKIKNLYKLPTTAKSNWESVETELQSNSFQGFKSEYQENGHRPGWAIYLNPSSYIKLSSSVVSYILIEIDIFSQLLPFELLNY